MTDETKDETIEVSGIRFNADEVKQVTIKRDGREITLGELEKDDRIGFNTERLQE